ncbi:MAG TPA: glycosyltransferase family 39 protein [Burkholderiales bacterium]|nr:glycosyltransferase family 39 protein [Burkholderiales bacterium]
MQQKSYYSFYKILITITILVNCIGLFIPILRNDDAVLYANIAKHIVLSKDWVNLIYNKLDWLDKPHFSFWVTALFFKIFGISSFSYILPGFIFHLLGAYYTYLLGCCLYNKEVGVLSSLLYLSAFHLMVSSIDVRAEAYLLGTIIPASYYWLLYDKSTKIKYLLLGAFFTALAVMTKGVFTILTIMSGLLSLWVYKKQVNKLFSIKWIGALILVFVFILPELIALYLQFNLHPEKIVFAHKNVSGIKWFFWDSQFGRFFNFGGITTNHIYDYHYLFFIHTFLWSFLPWSIIFIFAFFKTIKSLFIKYAINETNKIENKNNIVYLIGSFLPTFILFSISDFQLDHYTNIIIPFAAILSANFIDEVFKGKSDFLIFKIQNYFSLILFFLLLFISFLIITNKNFYIITIICFIILFVSIILKIRSGSLNYNLLSIGFSVIVINLIFIFTMFINILFSKYDEGYKIAKYLNNQKGLPIIDYNLNSLTLEFYAREPYLRINNVAKLIKYPGPYYLIIKKDEFIKIKPQFNKINDYKIIWQTIGMPIDKVVRNLIIDKQQLIANEYIVIQKN